MRKIHVVLIVIVALLPFVVAAAASVLLPIILASMDRTRPVEAVLVYEVESYDMPVNMQAMLAVVDRRVNRGWAKRARVRQIGDRRIEIGLFSDDPEEVRRIDRIATNLGTLEFRVLANNRDHPSIIAKAKSEDGDEVRDEDGHLLAWWVPVVRGQEDSFLLYPEIVTRKTDRAGKKGMEVLVVNDPFNVNGSYLANTRPGFDATGRPCINFTLNSRGGKLFRGLTENNLPDRPGVLPKPGDHPQRSHLLCPDHTWRDRSERPDHRRFHSRRGGRHGRRAERRLAARRVEEGGE